MTHALLMDIHGRLFREVWRYTKGDSFHCPTKGCFRNKGSYDIEVRGSDYCDNCGATMIARKAYYVERTYL